MSYHTKRQPIIISHRGLFEINGVIDRSVENEPTQVQKAIEQHGFDVEVDLWKFEDTFWLGHNELGLKHEVNFLWLERHKENLWIHCKNFTALYYFTVELNKIKGYKQFNCFTHDKDEYTLTSHGYIWAYPRDISQPGTIAVMPELLNTKLVKGLTGICTDYPMKYMKMIGDIS